MRKRLARFCGQRHVFTGVFARYSGIRKHLYMLVEGVRDERGRHITQHVWIALPGVAATLFQGDAIRFEAEIEMYMKGPRRHRTEDYGLCKPSNIQYIEQFEAEQEA